MAIIISNLTTPTVVLPTGGLSENGFLPILGVASVALIMLIACVGISRYAANTDKTYK